jgi:hypothetical protein
MHKLRLVLWDILHNCIAHPLLSLSCYSCWSIAFLKFTKEKIEDAKADGYGKSVPK